MSKKRKKMLEEIQRGMYDKAKQFRDDYMASVDTLDEMNDFLEQKRGFVLAGWCGSDACEEQVKEENGATSRNIPFEPAVKKSKCLVCGEQAKHTVVFGKAY